MPTPLHVHSWYSLLEGVSSPDTLLQRAAACGYTSLALTDTNNLYGAVPFVEQAYQHGVRPLLGACLRQHRTRCVALIADRAGYRSLCRILSRLHLSTGADLTTLLAEQNEGLHVLADDLVLAERLREAFGARLWLEVVRPPRSARQQQELLAFGRCLGLRPVASSAAHFATPQEHSAFRLVTAVRQCTLLDQVPRNLPLTAEHHLVDGATLAQRFRDLPQAVRNTDLLAEQLRSDVLPRDTVLPKPRLPLNIDEVRYLRLLCERGLRRRDLGGSLGARQRLREELTVIEAAELCGYFLVVRDIARHARRKEHSMALRGSAGNSLVCYLLEITDVDPLRFGLPLERFLHPGRADLPDIDLDFDWKVRDEVIAHVVRRWGPMYTARISSHLFLQTRSAFRESAKVHGLSNEQVSRLLETLSERVDQFLGGEGEAQTAKGPKTPPGFPLEAERWPRIVADARQLLGRPHHLSVHPGGVVLTPRPMEEYVPLQLAEGGVVLAQFDKDEVEYVGLVKIDLLGNRALATVDEANALATSATASRRVDPGGPDGGDEPRRSLEDGGDEPRRSLEDGGDEPRRSRFEDPATLDLLRRGDTLGVNQLESPAMRHLLVQMQPRGLDDLIQAIALIRPAAAIRGAKECFVRRRRGLDPIPPAHPAVAPLLRETEGLMIYEDDVLRVLQALTGLPATDADRFRKRVAKHQTEEEARRLAEEFLRLCDRHGVPRSVTTELWPQMAKFNHYSFCKSHSVSYGLIAWRAAWLKTHYPLAFWTAALNNNQGMYPRRVYIGAVKRAGIAVRLPCVNRSRGPFTVEGDTIRVGLDAIASLAQEFRTTLVVDRERRGPYRDLVDFRQRLQPGPETLALLIRCGALDFTGWPRPALFLQAELQDSARTRPGDASLFPAAGSLFPADAWSPSDYAAEQRLQEEWELLGFVTGPPLLSLFRGRLPKGLLTSRDLPDHVGRVVRVAGAVATWRQTPTEAGKVMQFVTLEDEWGLIEVTLFPDMCPQVAYPTLGPYVATGVVEDQYGVLTVTARRFQPCP